VSPAISILWEMVIMTRKMKEKFIQCHNERPEREAVSFSRTDVGYTPDKEVRCIYCGGIIDNLRDQLSIQEFVISGLCQKCQDATFGL